MAMANPVNNQITIPVATITLGGQQIAPGGNPVVLGGGVTADIQGSTLRLYLNRNEVFKMAAQVANNHLELDRAETPIAERRRGWGRLGLLLALQYGHAQGAITGSTGTDVEMSALSFWGGLFKGSKASIQVEITRHQNWITNNIPQPNQNVPVMVIRPRQQGAAPVRKKLSF